MQSHYLLHISLSSLKFVLVTYPSFMGTCKQLSKSLFKSRFVVAQFLKEQSTDGQSSLFHTKIAKACCQEWESWMTSVAIAMSSMCTCTGMVHNFCNSHALLLRLMGSDALVHLKMSTEYLGKSCRTAGWVPCQGNTSQQSRSKYNSMQCRNLRPIPSWIFNKMT